MSPLVATTLHNAHRLPIAIQYHSFVRAKLGTCLTQVTGSEPFVSRVQHRGKAHLLLYPPRTTTITMSDNPSNENAPAANRTPQPSAASKKTKLEQATPKAKAQACEVSTPPPQLDTMTLGGMKEAYKQEHDEEVIDINEYTPPHDSHRKPKGKAGECHSQCCTGIHS